MNSTIVVGVLTSISETSIALFEGQDFDIFEESLGDHFGDHFLSQGAFFCPKMVPFVAPVFNNINDLDML